MGWATGLLAPSIRYLMLASFALGLTACTGNYSTDFIGQSSSPNACAAYFASVRDADRAPASGDSSQLKKAKQALETNEAEAAQRAKAAKEAQAVKEAQNARAEEGARKALAVKEAQAARKAHAEEEARLAKKKEAEVTREVQEAKAHKEASSSGHAKVTHVAKEGKAFHKDSPVSDVPNTYKITEPGMSLSILSSMIYGTSKRWPEIAAWNGIEDPYRIYLGQTLVLKDPVKFTKSEMSERLLELKKVRLAKRNAKVRATKLAASVKKLNDSEVKRSLAGADDDSVDSSASSHPPSTDSPDAQDKTSDSVTPDPNDSSEAQKPPISENLESRTNTPE